MRLPHHSGGTPVSHPRRVTALLAVAVGIALAGATLGAVAADDPGEPVNIYGTATDEADNPVPEGTTVYALVDGEVEDSLTVTESGAFGGPDPFDDRLVVNTGAARRPPSPSTTPTARQRSRRSTSTRPTTWSS